MEEGRGEARVSVATRYGVAHPAPTATRLRKAAGVAPNFETTEPPPSEVPPHAAAIFDVLLAIMRPEIVLFEQHLPMDEPARPAQVQE